MKRNAKTEIRKTEPKPRSSYERSSSRENLYEERRRINREETDHVPRAPRKRGSDAERTDRSSVRTYREEKQDFKKSLKERSYQEYSYADDAYRETKRAERKRPERKPPQKKKKGKHRLRTALCVLLVIVLAFGIIFAIPSLRNPVFKGILKSPLGPVAGQLIFGGNYEKNVRDKDFDSASVRIHPGVKTPSGNLSVALFGVDARTEDLTYGTNADSMMVVNVDEKGEMKMASIFRDTYLMSRTKDGEEIISKANSAYSRGGPLGAVNMLNENFDLALTDYVVVNFWGMANIIDLIGGIRLTVTEEEKDALNYHMYEQNYYGGTKYKPLKKSGKSVLLNGDQATAFCRLRKVTFHSPADGQDYRDDYGRAARQRYVLMELLSQTKAQGMLKLMMLSNDLFAANGGDKKFIQTSMTMTELVHFFAAASDMNLTGSEGFPNEDHMYGATLDSGSTVVCDTLEDNVQLLHRFLYGTENYEPSDGLKKVAEQIRQEVFRQIGR